MLTTIILHIDTLTCIHLASFWQAQKLFAGLSFRLSEHFTLSCRQSLKELVVTAGGVVLEDDILIPQDPFAIGFPALCFIYNEEPPQEYDPRGLAKVKDERCEEAIDFFKKTGARVRGHTRVLDAIAALDIRYLLMESAPKVKMLMLLFCWLSLNFMILLSMYHVVFVALVDSWKHHLYIMLHLAW